MTKKSFSKGFGVAALGFLGLLSMSGQVAAQAEEQNHGDYVMEAAAMGYIEATIGSSCLKEAQPDGSVELVTPDECAKALDALEAELKGAAGLEDDLQQVLNVREQFDL